MIDELKEMCESTLIQCVLNNKCPNCGGKLMDYTSKNWNEQGKFCLGCRFSTKIIFERVPSKIRFIELYDEEKSFDLKVRNNNDISDNLMELDDEEYAIFEA